MLLRKSKFFLSTILMILTLIGCENSDSKAQSENSSNSAETTAKVTLIEYSDYECPACGQYYPLVKRLKKDFGDTLKLDLRFYPLSMHQYSALAARAAQSAKNQGKFLKMHDLLFENQKKWSDSNDPKSVFIGYAKKIGLNMDTFKHDLNAAKTQKEVMEEKASGKKMGVNSTPTFFIDGESIEPLPRSYAEFKQIVAKHISKDG